ncbi:MAG TPA: hypothetical protein VJ464_15955 [Blastocatellia bacterium]|nr:hypothetical protein [Blastocatellia bacterium]
MKERRRKMYAKISLDWKQMRPDLHHGSQEARDALHDFASAELRLPPIASLRELTIPQLKKLIEAMQREIAQPQIAGLNLTAFAVQVPATQAAAQAAPGEVVHLCSNEQAWAIGRVFSYLGWTDAGREAFLKRNFRRTNQRMLTVRQAGSAIRILLNIAASGDIKLRKGKDFKVPAWMIRAEIPALKRRIGLEAK